MLTNEQINTFVELHKRLGEKGFQYNFSYGSYGTEFSSMVFHKESRSTLSMSIVFVGDSESKIRLDAYRKQLIDLIELAA